MVIGLSGTDGFRSYLKDAIRVQEHHVDWTVHTVDYGLFKQFLKRLCQRRHQIRTMLRKSPDNRLSEEAIASALGASVLLTDFRRGLPNPVSRCDDDPHLNTQQDQQQQHEEGSNYVNLLNVDEGDIREVDSFEKRAKRKNRASVLRILAYEERKELVHLLRMEVEKVHMFYLSQWQCVSQILELHAAKDAPMPMAVGDEILELKAYCVMNVVAIYQILIRYDAYARTFEGTPIMDYWIKHNLHFATPFRKILQHVELTALADTYADMTEDSSVLFHFDAQRKLFERILEAAKAGHTTASSGHTLFRDSVVHTLRSWFLMASFEDRLGLEPSYLMMRGKSLKTEMQKIVEWRTNKLGTTPMSPMAQKKELSAMQVFNLTLNLLSGFLYCMNYYIVEPSSTMYVNRLGAFDAMSGTLIGMVPLAAFLSSIPYSMWTNHSFRSPFIMSSCLLVTGNLLYSAADQFRDVRIALLGRFITGLGAPKCIIRRYMADTTPMSLRTTVNAMFGMVVAAGSAMGPAMAIVLNSFEFTFYSPLTGQVVLNGLTLPGYFMAILWITFSIIVILTLDEPDREGLEEQRRMESSAGQSTVDAFSSKSPRTLVESDLNTIFSGESMETGVPSFFRRNNNVVVSPSHGDDLPVPLSLEVPNENLRGWKGKFVKYYLRVKEFTDLITTPVRICLGLLFAKVFTIEILVSATSSLSKNRYRWKVHEVGSLGFANGCLVIPFSIFIGRLSLSLQDRKLMRFLVTGGIFGLFLLIDLTDLVYTGTGTYNAGHVLAVGPRRYVTGYFLTYLSIQTFEGVIGSTLSKVIPTALASGTFNSGLLATLVDTLGRACGDNFISMAGFISIRQLMNLLFIPGFLIMLTCLIVIERCRDMLSV